MIDKILQSKLFKTSLRVKMLLAFVLPTLVIVSVFLYYHDRRTQAELRDLVESRTINVGNMALSSMKNAMLNNDFEEVGNILNNIATLPSVQEMRIVNCDFRVVFSTFPEETGAKLDAQKTGCVECHNLSVAERPRVATRINEDLLRVVSPIVNEPECQTCHAPEVKCLGVLIIDAQLATITERAEKDRIYNLELSIALVSVIAAISYLMIQWLVVRRVGVLYEYLGKFAAGNFSVRIPKVWHTEDEITHLADYFNDIADALERHEKAEREITIVRQEAITEEREKIARDLHDGVAQLLAYLTTKISATRMAMAQDQLLDADNHLLQMDEAIQKQTTEVRAMIAGLRVLGQTGAGLVRGIEEYVKMCDRITDMEVGLDCDAQARDLRLSPETELQLMRIAQEAIGNARKHSSATKVTINLKKEKDELLLEIVDNGSGFDPWEPALWRAPRFGLRTMSERAEKIGASFKVHSAPGKGTRVLTRLNLSKEML